MVGFLHFAVGPVKSRIVNLAVQPAVLPPESVAFKVTVLIPTSEQLKVLGLRDKLNPQLSELPLFTADADTVTVPFGPKLTTAFLHLAMGRIGSFTVTTHGSARGRSHRRLGSGW